MKSVSFNKLQETHRRPLPKTERVDTYDIKTEQVLDGVVYKTIVTKVKRTENLNKGQMASDYRLDNLLAAGVTDLLTPTPKLSTNPLDSIDNISVAGNTIADSIVITNETNNSINTESDNG